MSTYDLKPTERRLTNIGELAVGMRARRTERSAQRLIDRGVSKEYIARERAGGVVKDIVTSDKFGWTSVAVALPKSDVYPSPLNWFTPDELEVMP